MKFPKASLWFHVVTYSLKFFNWQQLPLISWFGNVCWQWKSIKKHLVNKWTLWKYCLLHFQSHVLQPLQDGHNSIKALRTRHWIVCWHMSACYKCINLCPFSVVDVHQKWCGPCKAITGMLRRIKNELGDDYLAFAVVSTRSDSFFLRKQFYLTVISLYDHCCF